MPWFEGAHTEIRELPVPPEAALAHFADLAAILAATKSVESGEIDGRTIHFVLEEEDHTVLKFKPDFSCTYVPEGNTLRWTTREGNLDQSGEARFEPNGAGTSLHYTEAIKMDIDVSSLMVPMLKPVFSAIIANEIKGYLDRMVKSLPR